MFTRHQAALKAEQSNKMAGIEINEIQDPQTTINRKSTDPQMTDTSDEEFHTEFDEDASNSQLLQTHETTHRVLSPQIRVHSPHLQTAELCSDMTPHTPISVNKKHRVYTKKRSLSRTALSQDPPLAEGDFANKGEPVNQNNSYLLDNLSQLINSALSRMTDALGKVFRTTIQEVHHENEKKVSETQIQQSPDTRTEAMIGSDRKKLPFLAPARELDDKSDSSGEESVRTKNGSVSTTDIFHSRGKTNSVKLPAFRGELGEKWKAYINRFEAVARHHNWTEEDKLGQLLPRLQGPAGEFAFEELRPDVLSNYGRLIRELGNRFGLIETNRTYQTKFRRRDQKNGEHVQEYAAELKGLYSKAYPKRDNLTKQEDLVSRFLLGLVNGKARTHVELNREPQSIEEAVEYVIEFEEVTRYYRDEGEQPYGNHKRSTRQVRNLTSDNSTDGSKTADQKYYQPKDKEQNKAREKSANSNEKDFKTQQGNLSSYITRDELKEVIHEILNSQKSQSPGTTYVSKKPIVCYRCGEQGHFANRCKNEKTNKGYKPEKPLNPQATDFKPNLNY